MGIEEGGESSSLWETIDAVDGGSWRSRCHIRPLQLEPILEVNHSTVQSMADGEKRSGSI